MRSQRSKRQMGQAELAAAVDLAISTISRMETGLAAIDLEQLERIAQAFEMEPEQLIFVARRTAQIAAAAEAAEAALYKADGTLDPASIIGIELTDAEMDDLPISDTSSKG